MSGSRAAIAGRGPGATGIAYLRMSGGRDFRDDTGSKAAVASRAPSATGIANLRMSSGKISAMIHASKAATVIRPPSPGGNANETASGSNSVTTPKTMAAIKTMAATETAPPPRQRDREPKVEPRQRRRDEARQQGGYREEPQPFYREPARHREPEAEDDRRQSFREDGREQGGLRDQPPYSPDPAPEDQLHLDFRADDRKRRSATANARRSENSGTEERPVRHDGRPDREPLAAADTRRVEPERNDRPPAGWDRFDRVTVSAAERERVERAALRAAARDRFERVAADVAERNRQEQVAANVAQRNRHEALAPSAAVDEIRDASINKAVAEITARQRALDSDAIASPSRTAPPPPPAPPQEPERVIAAWTESELAQKVGEGSVDISGLQHQLREMTARIEALRPSAELEKAVNGLRSDLAEIGRSLTEALPRRALEDLEIEVKTLGQRIDDSRQSGVDATALASIEHGLAEIREALRGLTPAESLVGFDEAVQGLTKKIDAIASKKEDPAALQQLETAIGALRGMVSHVASNDTLTKVADDVRALAAKVDSLAASETPKLSALENRIDILAAALNASAEAGQAVPRELEKLLSGLVEKLEWVQLSHTDHTALAHLEDRIATLVKRLDASDARLGLLEGVERGLGDLLVYIEQLRDTDGAGAKTSVAKISVAKTSVAKTSVAKTSVAVRLLPPLPRSNRMRILRSGKPSAIASLARRRAWCA